MEKIRIIFGFTSAEISMQNPPTCNHGADYPPPITHVVRYVFGYKGTWKIFINEDCKAFSCKSYIATVSH